MSRICAFCLEPWMVHTDAERRSCEMDLASDNDTYRDPAPEVPDCPLCESRVEVGRHGNPHQGQWLCRACMLLFDGTSAEYLPAGERPDISDELAAARAALEEARDR